MECFETLINARLDIFEQRIQAREKPEGRRPIMVDLVEEEDLKAK